MNINYCFPTIFGSETLDIDTSELNKIDDFRTKIHHGTYMSGNVRILELLSLTLIKNQLTELINTFFNKVGYRRNKFVITTSWINKIEKGGRILEHLHGNSFYSGCLYFQDDYSQATPLEYRHPNRYTRQICPRCEDPFHSGCSWIPPVVPNLLILFPSQIIHCSDTHLGPPRKSLAFNIMPTGFVGDIGDSVYDTEWLNL
tara:strand:- start:832 stop:1434 length:603 start_codon:yes stop_codon:yes gene_type:complete